MSLKQKIAVITTAGATAIALVVIAHFEGVRYEPYRDVAGVLTVCYGHTGKDIFKARDTHNKDVMRYYKSILLRHNSKSMH